MIKLSDKSEKTRVLNINRLASVINANKKTLIRHLS